MTELQARLLVGGQPEGDADQGVDVVASQQGQGCQLVLSAQCIFIVMLTLNFILSFYF